jgi:hypothetical protein
LKVKKRTAAVIKEMVNGPQGQGLLTNLKIIKEMLGLVVDRCLLAVES